MKRKLLFIISALILSLTLFVASACDDEVSAPDSSSSKNPEPEIVFEGDMQLNGFNSVKDMYAVKQITEWSFTPVGKLDIVGKDNFIPEPSGLESDEVINAVIAKIDALPAADAVTISDKDEINKARRAYGSLSDAGKKKITNVSKLKEVENAAAVKNVYTVADFGGSYTNDIKDAGGWVAFSGNLVNEKEGTVYFKVKGINGNIDGAFYITLYHDASKDPGQAGDGIMSYLNTQGKTLLFPNAGNQVINFNEGKNFTADKTYTFVYGYKVADDYSKVTISVKASDEGGDVIVEGSVDVASIGLTNFGTQTVNGWLNEHANKNVHKTFFLDTGNSSGVDVSSAWTGVKTSDFAEPSNDDPHTASDLAPREGDGALRVYYESGAFKELFAHFDNSVLKGLPASELGGISVKIYNDSAVEKAVALSLMRNQNQVLAIDGGEFTLEPYKWTECKVTLDPVIIDYFANDIIGIAIDFNTKYDSVYYLDDLRVQFGKTYSEEIKALMQQVETLKTDIAAYEGKIVTVDDKEALEEIYTRYASLPQAYRFTVDNVAILDTAIESYFFAYNAAEKANEQKTILMLDSVLGAKQIGSFSGGTAEYVTDVHQKDQVGSLKITFNGSMEWVTVPLQTTQNGEEFDELHVWIKNASESKRAFQLSWNPANTVACDENGNEVDIPGGYVIPANSEWIELVFKHSFNPTEFNITSLNAGNGAIISVDTLYVGKVVAITNVGKVNAQIAALADYAENYSDENKAAVSAARAAYGALSLSSKKKITNLAKLIGIEASIWKEGFAALPVDADHLTEYTDEYKTAIEALRASYEALPADTKEAVADEEALLAEFEAKILTFRAQTVNTIAGELNIKDGVYTVNEIKKIKNAANILSAMSETEKAMLNDGVEDKIAALSAKIENYVTTTDLGGDFAKDIIGAGGWNPYSGNLVNAKEGTIVFKAKGFMQNSEASIYIALFHDLSKNKGQAADGISSMVQTNNNRLLFFNAGDKAIGFNEGKSISIDKTYTFYYSYVVADDYSKVTISVRIDDDAGDVIVDGKVEISEFNLQDFGSQTINSWLAEHENKDNHKTFYINIGFSDSVDITKAW